MYSLHSTHIDSYQPLSKNVAINPSPREVMSVQSYQSCKKNGVCGNVLPVDNMHSCCTIRKHTSDLIRIRGILGGGVGEGGYVTMWHQRSALKLEVKTWRVS